mgnify:CR=1 FL=1
MPVLEQNLKRIVDLGIESLFMKIVRGIEKESLRVDPEGGLAMTPHPEALGSALTNPAITTDYCEAQLEFVSPPTTDIDDLTSFLTDAHHFTYQNIGDEKLWVNSMPCILYSEESIPIARYGVSNVAQMKETYRLGLGYRYGRLMQTISGIHYNFSLPQEFWHHYLGKQPEDVHKDDISDQYMSLIRNFHRHTWLLFYLFGASPSVCKSFLKGHRHQLQEYAGNSFYAPYATSLRMSDLGYSNDAQKSIKVCYNELENYTSSLVGAMQTPYPDYERIGVKVDGKYRQLNANLLQIENEYYSPVRPKRVARSGEQPTAALRRDGIEYVEIRSLDINMFDPTGINQNTMRFIEALLIYCLLEDSPALDEVAIEELNRNHTATAKRGRDPDFHLLRNGQTSTVREWATEILDNVLAVAEIIDGHENDQSYADAVRALRPYVDHPETTMSARIISELKETGSSFFEFALGMAKCHRDYFASIAPLREAQEKRLRQEVADSVQRQQEVEAADDITLDEYLQRYFQSC